MKQVGSNAIIGRDVRLGDDVIIGDNVILEGRVRIGKGTRIDHFCVIRGNVSIGKNNWIYPFASIGTGAHHMAHTEDPKRPLASRGRISIGDNNILREFLTVTLPAGDGLTRVGSGVYVMTSGHIGHNCAVHDGAILSQQSSLGGFVEVQRGANIGLNCSIHQTARVGAYAMVGMGSAVIKDVLPFSILNQGTFTKVNRRGLEAARIPRRDIDGIFGTYARFPEVSGKGWYVNEIRRFIRESKRGFYSPVFAGRHPDSARK